MILHPDVFRQKIKDCNTLEQWCTVIKELSYDLLSGIVGNVNPSTKKCRFIEDYVKKEKQETVECALKLAQIVRGVDPGSVCFSSAQCKMIGASTWAQNLLQQFYAKDPLRALSVFNKQENGELFAYVPDEFTLQIFDKLLSIARPVYTGYIAESLTILIQRVPRLKAEYIARLKLSIQAKDTSLVRDLSPLFVRLVPDAHDLIEFIKIISSTAYENSTLNIAYKNSICVRLINDYINVNCNDPDKIAVFADLLFANNFQSLISSSGIKLSVEQTLELLHSDYPVSLNLTRYDDNEKLDLLYKLGECNATEQLQPRIMLRLDQFLTIPELQLKFVLESLNTEEDRKRYSFLMHGNSLYSLAEALFSAHITLSPEQGAKVLRNYWVTDRQWEPCGLRQRHLDTLGLNFTELYDKFLTSVLQGYTNLLWPASYPMSQDDSRDPGLVMNFSHDILTKIYRSVIFDSTQDLCLFEAAILRKQDLNAAVPAAKQMFCFLNSLLVYGALEPPTREHDQRYPKWNPPLTVKDLAEDLMGLNGTKSDYSERIKDLRTKMLLHLGAIHPLSKATAILDNIELSDENSRLKAAKIINWLTNVAFHYTSNTIDYAHINEHKALHEKILSDLAHHPDDEQRTILTLEYFRICNDPLQLECLHRLTKGLSAKIYFIAIMLTPLAAQNSEFEATICEKILAVIKRNYKDGKAQIIILHALAALLKNQQITDKDKIALITEILLPIPVKVTPLLVSDVYPTTIANDDRSTAIIVTPCMIAGTKDVAISYLSQGSRLLIFANQHAKFAPLTAQIHGYCDQYANRPILIDKVTSAITQNGFLTAQIKREMNLWLALQAVASFSVLPQLMEQLASKSIDEATLNVILKALDLSDDPVLKQRFIEKILNNPDGNAVFAYAVGLKQLPEEDQKYYAVFTKFLQNVLNEEFYSTRYRVDDNPHLQSIAQHSNILERWKKNCSLDLQAFNDVYSISPTDFKEIDIGQYVYNKIVLHGHLEKNSFPLLFECLGNKQYPEQGLDEVSMAIMKLMQSQDLPITEKLQLIGNCLGIVPYDSEFNNDLKFLQQYYRTMIDTTKIKNMSRYTLQFTDNWWLLFMAGTHVEGSCQRVYGESCLNKHLMAYVTAPHIKLITIVSPENTTIMRAIIRLGFDDIANTPVVHLEEIYSANGCPLFLAKTIHKFAAFVAKYQLHCDLLVSNLVEEDLPKYANPVTVSHVPYGLEEYVDANHRSEPAPYMLTDNNWLVHYKGYLEQIGVPLPDVLTDVQRKILKSAPRKLDQ